MSEVDQTMDISGTPLSAKSFREVSRNMTGGIRGFIQGLVTSDPDVTLSDSNDTPRTLGIGEK